MKEEIYYCDKCGKESAHGQFGMTPVTIQESTGIIKLDLCRECLLPVKKLLGKP